jgi:hypothetical protein
MRQTMPRKRALVAAGNQAAKNLMQLLDYRCEWCRRNYPGVEVHEIDNGSHRLKCRTEPYATLCLCQECHVQLHRFAMPERVLAALAILYHSRSSDYSLSKYIALACPQAPSRYTQHDVDIWILRLVSNTR